MNLSKKKIFQLHAAKVLEHLYQEGDEERIYQALCEEDPSFKGVKLSDFRGHYTCARIAMISLAWEKCCRELKMTDSDCQMSARSYEVTRCANLTPPFFGGPYHRPAIGGTRLQGNPAASRGALPCGQKAFLKNVMNSFKNPKSLALATVFSEYYCAPQSEEQDSDLVAIAGLLFKKTGLQPVIKMTEDEQMITRSFQLLVEILEGLRTAFENEFFEWVHSEASRR